MRIYDETRTLPMPRRKMVIVPQRSEPVASVPRHPEPVTVGKPISEKRAALIAKAANVKIILDPSRFLEASREISERGFQLAVNAAGLSLRAALNPKGVHKAPATIEEHGPASVSLMLQGRLGPHNTVQSAGLSR